MSANRPFPPELWVQTLASVQDYREADTAVGGGGASRRGDPLKPVRCGHCQPAWRGADPQPQRHQVTELPPLKLTVTEYQLHRLSYVSCGAAMQAVYG